MSNPTNQYNQIYGLDVQRINQNQIQTVENQILAQEQLAKEERAVSNETHHKAHEKHVRDMLIISIPVAAVYLDKRHEELGKVFDQLTHFLKETADNRGLLVADLKKEGYELKRWWDKVILTTPSPEISNTLLDKIRKADPLSIIEAETGPSKEAKNAPTPFSFVPKPKNE